MTNMTEYSCASIIIVQIIVDMRIFCSAFVASVSESGHGLLVISLYFFSKWDTWDDDPQRTDTCWCRSHQHRISDSFVWCSGWCTTRTVCAHWVGLCAVVTRLLNPPPQIVIICCKVIDPSLTWNLKLGWLAQCYVESLREKCYPRRWASCGPPILPCPDAIRSRSAGEW